MRPIIEFCVNNMHHGTDKVMEHFEANPEYDVVEYGCLGNCGECYLSAFAIVNGETVAAESAEVLLHVINDKIEELKQWEQIDVD